MCVFGFILNYRNLDKNYLIFKMRYLIQFGFKLDNCLVFFFYDNIFYYLVLFDIQCLFLKEEIFDNFIRYIYVLLIDFKIKSCKVLFLVFIL